LKIIIGGQYVPTALKHANTVVVSLFSVPFI